MRPWSLPGCNMPVMGGGYTPIMKLALLAKVTIDSRRLLKSRWVHDTAHRIVDSLRKAQDEARKLESRRKH